MFYIDSQGRYQDLGDLGDDVGIFEKYWNIVKDRIWELRLLGNRISNLQLRAQSVRNKAIISNPSVANDANTVVQNLSKIKVLWNGVNTRIVQYINYWHGVVGQKATTPAYINKVQKPEDIGSDLDNPWGETSGIGYVDNDLGIIATIVISATALAALGYVAVNGMQVLKDYRIQEMALHSLERKLITPQAASQFVGPLMQRPQSLISRFLPSSNILLWGGVAVAAVFILPRLMKKGSGS